MYLPPFFLSPLALKVGWPLRPWIAAPSSALGGENAGEVNPISYAARTSKMLLDERRASSRNSNERCLYAERSEAPFSSIVLAC